MSDIKYIDSEIKKLEDELDTKENEIQIIKKRINYLNDKKDLSDYEGKCLHSIGDIYSNYIKVKRVYKTSTGSLFAEGIVINVCAQLIGISYNVSNKGNMPINNCEIIDEDSFNKILNKAIKSFE